MSGSRLAMVAPGLMALFSQATSERQRGAALLACELAAERVGLDVEGLATALEHLRRGARSDASVSPRIKELATRLDDQYLDLHGQEDASNAAQVDGLFVRARLAFALDLALHEPPEELHEAIYEALIAVGEDPEVIRRITALLRG